MIHIVIIITHDKFIEPNRVTRVETPCDVLAHNGLRLGTAPKASPSRKTHRLFKDFCVYDIVLLLTSGILL